MSIREFINMAEKMAKEFGDDSAEILFYADGQEGREAQLFEPTGFYYENETTICLKEVEDN